MDTQADRANGRRSARPKVSIHAILPYLWFDDEAEVAARLSTSLFRSSRITVIHRYPDGGPGPAGQVMTVESELAGPSFIALNGGPRVRFTEAISIPIGGRTQKDVDRLWGARSPGGRRGRCGWLVDRFGVSWPVLPRRFGELLSDPDEERAARVLAAMMKMRKIDIPKLEQAHRGR